MHFALTREHLAALEALSLKAFEYIYRQIPTSTFLVVKLRRALIQVFEKDFESSPPRAVFFHLSSSSLWIEGCIYKELLAVTAFKLEAIVHGVSLRSIFVILYPPERCMIARCFGYAMVGKAQSVALVGFEIDGKKSAATIAGL